MMTAVSLLQITRIVSLVRQLVTSTVLVFALISSAFAIDAPQITSSTLSQNNVFTFGWQSVVDATGYNVYRDNVYLTTINAPGTDYTDSNPGSSYYVTAFNSNATPTDYSRSSDSNRVSPAEPNSTVLSGYVFSRTDITEFRWISTNSDNQVGSVWIDAECAARLGPPAETGNWTDLITLAPAFDTLDNPCSGPAPEPNPVPEPPGEAFVFSRTDIVEYRYIALNNNGEIGSVWIDQACATSLGGATVTGGWNDLISLAPAFDSLDNPCSGEISPPSVETTATIYDPFLRYYSSTAVELVWYYDDPTVSIWTFDIYRDGSYLGSSGSTVFWDDTRTSGQSYSYEIRGITIGGEYVTSGYLSGGEFEQSLKLAELPAPIPPQRTEQHTPMVISDGVGVIIRTSPNSATRYSVAEVLEKDNNGNWSIVGALEVSDLTETYRFTSVAASGEWIALGVLPTTGGGRVHIFRRSADGSWNEKQVFSGSYLQLGSSMVMNDRTLMVSTSDDRVIVYTRLSGDEFIYSDRLIPPHDFDAGSNPGFGSSIAFSGSVAVIGGKYDDRNQNTFNAGVAYIFYANNSGQWYFKQEIYPEGAAVSGQQFGAKVVIDNNRIFVSGASDEPERQCNNLRDFI